VGKVEIKSYTAPTSITRQLADITKPKSFFFVIEMTEDKRVEPEIQLQALSQAISESPDFVSALTIALSKVCELTNCDYAEAWIPYKDTKLLELSPAWYINTHKGSAYLSTLEQFRLCSEAFILSPGIGLPGRVWSSQQPEWICDVSAESETYFLRNHIAKAFGIKAGFGIPVLGNHQGKSAVLVFFMLEAREVDKQLVDLAQAAATQLELFLEHSLA